MSASGGTDILVLISPANAHDNSGAKEEPFNCLLLEMLLALESLAPNNSSSLCSSLLGPWRVAVVIKLCPLEERAPELVSTISDSVSGVQNVH